MAPATPDNPFSGQRARTTSSQPQRVFVNSSNQVSRPPVLFRVPAVKPDKGAEASAAAVASSDPTPAPTTAAIPVAAPASGERLAANPARAVRPPHFAPTPVAPAHTPAATVPPANENIQFKVISPAPASESAAMSRLDAADPYYTQSESEKSAATELARAQERTAKSRPVAIPPIAPLPASKSWMEIIGSRVVIILLIGAIAAIAIFANREPVLDSDGSLTTIQLEGMDSDVAAKSASKSPAKSPSKGASDLQDDGSEELPRSNAETKKVTQSNQSANSANTQPQSPEMVIAPPANSGRVEATKPDFDLATLNPPLDTGSAEVKPSVAPTSPALPVDKPRISVSANTASVPSNNLPSNNNTTAGATAGNWRDDLKAMAPSNTVSRPIISQPPATESPIRTNSWANLPPYESIKTPAAGITADEAIQAVIDAAITPEQLVPTNDGRAPYSLTTQPQGIVDWSRYLPAESPGMMAPNAVPGYQNPAPNQMYQGQNYQPVPNYQGPNYQGPNYQGPNYQGPNYQGPNYQGPGVLDDAYPSTNFPVNNYVPGGSSGSTAPLVPPTSMNPANSAPNAQRSFTFLPGQAAQAGQMQAPGNTFPMATGQPHAPQYMQPRGGMMPAGYGNGTMGGGATDLGFEGQTGFGTYPGVNGQ